MIFLHVPPVPTEEDVSKAEEVTKRLIHAMAASWSEQGHITAPLA